LINWAAKKQVFRKIAHRHIGLAEQRLFPKFGKAQSFSSIRENLIKMEQVDPSRFDETCLFLPDTFTHYFEPEIEKSALAVLQACGIRARVLPIFGAGRTLLSKGFIEPARQHARHLLDEIRRADPHGDLAIVGLEPSEIYTLRDELLDLFPDRGAEIELVAARAWLIDEYLIRPNPKTHALRLARAKFVETRGTKSKILLHGHCYQKAQLPHADGFAVGVNASAGLLRSAGYQVGVVNSGCCGMAGAFGYEAEHYVVSTQVGELKLFPHIRQVVSGGDTLVAATGTSCRSQIVEGTGVQANHTIKFVAQILKD
jgi:Fe-S oxidoreductase